MSTLDEMAAAENRDEAREAIEHALSTIDEVRAERSRLMPSWLWERYADVFKSVADDLDMLATAMGHDREH